MHDQAVVFDLDGTLLDTLADLGGAMNSVLQNRDLPPHPLAAYRYFVGNGARRLVEQALPPDRQSEADVTGCLEAFRLEYSQTWNHQTGLYTGVPEMLRGLAEKAIPLAVLTNKPQPFADRCVRAFFAEGTFVAVCGQQEGIPLKPDPTGALAIAHRLGIRPQDCLYLGDSDVDMRTAVQAGMRPVGAAWGFRTEAELREAGAATLIGDPRELLDLID